jgi:hypothetical protein
MFSQIISHQHVLSLLPNSLLRPSATRLLQSVQTKKMQINLPLPPLSVAISLEQVVHSFKEKSAPVLLKNRQKPQIFCLLFSP